MDENLVRVSFTVEYVCPASKVADAIQMVVEDIRAMDNHLHKQVHVEPAPGATWEDVHSVFMEDE
jgi:Zn ribbon nucleic-acid-binding protein